MEISQPAMLSIVCPVQQWTHLLLLFLVPFISEPRFYELQLQDILDGRLNHNVAETHLRP